MAIHLLTAASNTDSVIELKSLSLQDDSLPGIIAGLSKQLEEHEATWHYKLHHFLNEHAFVILSSAMVIGAALGIYMLALTTDKLATSYITEIIGLCVISGLAGAVISIPPTGLFFLCLRMGYSDAKDLRAKLMQANQKWAYENFMRLIEGFLQDPCDEKIPTIFKEFSSIPNAEFPLSQILPHHISEESHRTLLNCLFFYTLLQIQKKPWDGSALTKLCAQLEVLPPSDKAIAYFEEHYAKMPSLLPKD